MNCRPCSSTILKGFVLYDDGIPCQNAVIILEQISITTSRKANVQYATTNSLGEFYFNITNTNVCYKLKIFDNFNNTNDQCNINLY